MPKTTKSKSGLFEILKVKAAKSEFDVTEVEIRIPKFQNFGLGLAERERQSAEYEKKREAGMPPAELAKKEAEWAKEEAEGDAILKQFAENMRGAVAESKKEISKAPPDDKDIGMANLLVNAMEQLAQSLEDGPDEPDPDDAPPQAKESRPEDFETFLVLPHHEMKWNKATETLVDKFIRDWPNLRLEVLKAAHKYYRKLYPELKETYGDMTEFNFIMPKPTSPQSVEDIFSIQTIHLHKDGEIGLSGSCTWDEEHGFGVRIKNGKVAAFGDYDGA